MVVVLAVRVGSRKKCRVIVTCPCPSDNQLHPLHTAPDTLSLQANSIPARYLVRGTQKKNKGESERDSKFERFSYLDSSCVCVMHRGMVLGTALLALL